MLEAAGLGQSGMARTPDEIAPKIHARYGDFVQRISYDVPGATAEQIAALKAAT